MRRIVEATLVEGASVARIARAHGVNTNQVFGWRKLYLAGRLSGGNRDDTEMQSGGGILRRAGEINHGTE